MTPRSEPAAGVAIGVPFRLQRFRCLSELRRLAPEYFPGGIELRKEFMYECSSGRIRYFFSTYCRTIAMVVFRKSNFDAGRMDRR